MNAMQPLEPLYTADLFLPLHQELVSLLRGLAPTAWDRPTLAGAWRVRDVAAHLLDGDLRKLSAYRDGHAIPMPRGAPKTFEELTAALNRLNADWVRAARRMSTRVLVELIEVTGPAVAALMASLPPHEPALFAVNWAGEDQSENWLDIGREYTERWHHQMQIREAVGAPGLVDRRWLFPLLEISARALPRAYAPVTAREGASVVLDVTGEAGGAWCVVRGKGAWEARRGGPQQPDARVRLDADAAWRLYFNALPLPEARRRATVEGDADLAAPMFAARAVMV